MYFEIDNTASELNLSELASDAGISQPTAKQWLTALRVGSLIALLPPHFSSFRKRLRKRPKLHFLDSGLVCYLLGIHDGGRSHGIHYAERSSNRSS